MDVTRPFSCKVVTRTAEASEDVLPFAVAGRFIWTGVGLAF